MAASELSEPPNDPGTSTSAAPVTKTLSKKPGSDRNYGLALLYPVAPETVTSTHPKFDIIAIHGLDAESPKTWYANLDPDDPSSEQINWLRDDHMLPNSRRDSRIMTYDWNANYDSYASKVNFLAHAETLLDDIYEDRKQTDRLKCPLIFTPSCYGGLLLLQALLRATDNFPKPKSDQRRQVLDYTVGVTFLGTPFRGSWATGTAALDARLDSAAKNNKEYTRELGMYLKMGTPEKPSPLGPLVQRFSQMVSEDEFKFDIVCAYESRDTYLDALKKRAPTLEIKEGEHRIIVDPSSACLDGQDKLAMDSRHNMMHKHNSETSIGFIRLASTFQRFVEGSDKVLARKANARGRSNFHHTDSMNIECLEALHIVDPNSTMEEIEIDTEKQLPEVCQWILDTQEYAALTKLGNDESCCPEDKLIWIEGASGTGKTMLLMSVIRELLKPSSEPSEPSEPRPSVSYYFFRSTGNQFLNSATSALRSLIWMLVQDQWHLLSHVRKAYKKHGSGLFDDNTAFVRLTAIFEDILNDSQLSPAYFVVDALNECNSGLKALLDDVILPSAKSSKVKWLVSSSWERISWEKLQQAQKRTVSLTSEKLEDPILTYIDSKLAKLTGKDGLDDVKEELRKLIKSRSNGRFLWVALAFKEIGGVSGWDAVNAVNQLPSGLRQAYDHTFTRIDDRTSTSDRDAERCRMILSVIYLSFDQLSHAELTVLAGLTANMLPTLIKRCGSFLTAKGDKVSLWHDSAKSWCRDNLETKLKPSENFKGHFNIYKCSIENLALTLKRNICAPVDGVVVSPKTGPLAPVCYSSKFWVRHLIESGSSDDPGVEDFLYKHFLHWIESLCHLDALPQSTTYLGQMLRGGKIQSEELVEFLKDAEKYLLTHGSLIEEAPLQTYGSALVFSPLASQVRNKMWRQRLPCIESVKGIRDSDVCLQILEDHREPVHATAFSQPGARWLASASHDGIVKLWDVTIGKCKKTFTGHGSSVLSAAFFPETKVPMLASASTDRTIKIWNLETGNLEETYRDHPSTILAIAFSPNGDRLATASYDSKIRLCRVEARTGLRMPEEHWDEFSGHEAAAFSVVFAPEGRILASASQDRTIKLWDSNKRVLLKTLKGHDGWVSSVAYSPDGKTLASASHDCTIRLWDAAKGTTRQRLRGHQAPVFSVAFSPSGQTLASSSQDHTITTWNIDKGKPQMTFKGHSGGVGNVAFSPDGQKLASASYDHTVRIWDAKAHQEAHRRHSGPVLAVVFSRDGRMVASASHDHTIRLWSSAGEHSKILQGHEGPVNTIKFSPDGQVIASASTDGTVRLWTIKTGKYKKMHHDYSVTALAFSPDGKLVASASTDGSVNIWDTYGKRKKAIKIEKWVTAIAFSPSGTTLALASYDRMIQLWNINTGIAPEKIDPGVECLRVQAIAFSTNDKKLAWGSAAGDIGLWDIATRSYQGLDHGTSAAFIVFSKKDGYLKTDQRSLKISVEHSDERNPFQDDIFIDGEWVTRGSERLLMLSKGYKPTSSAINGNTVVLGHADGGVTFLNFNSKL
ncbi:hypothetical protein B0J13DRAFT_565635 [Dactylonectria estremocensis]|uniref:NACHT domain-containing protein n=1 Tax=Dactylonectria estremocensis TaxID=1079267 RepID=A0A9P9DWH6_9HYPO|nr:hypothetical protein B0J13DRAFT_565635 [Dactylonectria estremocensis]